MGMGMGGNRELLNGKKMGMGFKLQMGMGMKSLKWEGIGTKNQFPHTSNSVVYLAMVMFFKLSLARF